ncbi:hypothetical protein U724_06880 [Pseudomonas chlororaphis subsp. aurantiaca PB-St2]|nr:hypothetical protein U724_06880 [Pseudomonas chlororaphis subsp. aurantiaca PB-St2]
MEIRIEYFFVMLRSGLMVCYSFPVFHSAILIKSLLCANSASHWCGVIMLPLLVLLI